MPESLDLNEAIIVATKPRRRVLLPEHRKRGLKMVVPVNKTEMERYQDGAIRAEKSLAAWVRELCEAATKETIEDAGHQEQAVI